MAVGSTMTMDFLDFDAARQRADERLNQELVRIRNLPKKSKITICNKHGLKHAHHMNTGLLKGLEIDLDVIHRERRRVVNELNKKRKVFTTTTKKSFPGLLPLMEHERNPAVPNHKSPKRFRSSWNQTDFSIFKSQQNIQEEKHKREFLLALTEQSKQQTKNLIHNNVNKLRNGVSQAVELEKGPFVTKLSRRGIDFRTSCFPSLLQREDNYDRNSLIRNGNTMQIHRTLDGIREQSLPSIQNQTQQMSNRTGRFKDIVNEKVILPSIIKSKEAQNNFRKTVLMASKRKGMKLDGNLELGKKTLAFTKHWS